MSTMKRLALSLLFAALFLVAALVSFPCVAGALLFLVASHGLNACNTAMRYSRDNLRMLWATSFTVETPGEGEQGQPLTPELKRQIDERIRFNTEMNARHSRRRVGEV